MRQQLQHYLLPFICLSFFCVQGQDIQKEAAITVDLKKEIAPMKPVWAWFGYDEPNYTYMKDGKKLLSEIAALSPVPVYVRAHSLMSTGDGTPALKWGSTNMYTEDAKGNPCETQRSAKFIYFQFLQGKP